MPPRSRRGEKRSATRVYDTCLKKIRSTYTFHEMRHLCTKVRTRRKVCTGPGVTKNKLARYLCQFDTRRATDRRLRPSRVTSRRGSRRRPLPQFAAPIGERAKRAIDWTPIPPGNPDDYRVRIHRDGRVAHDGEFVTYAAADQRRFSYVMLPDRRIYAFNNQDRNHLMCSADVLKERGGPQHLRDKSCADDTECCLYHGKLVKLLLDHGVANPDKGLLSAGEFVVDRNAHLVSVSNQSGHFFPPNVSNDNFVSVVSLRLSRPSRILVRDWESGMPSERRVTIPARHPSRARSR